MRRILTALLFALILTVSAPAQVLAAGKIEITLQPQNMVFPENSSAYWTVEATGDDLVYDWFIVYKGVAYNTTRSFVENHPWQEGVVGDGYGRNDVGNGFFINGIGSALDGAEIYCVVSNKTGSVTSRSAYISVGGTKSPPQLKVPASVTVEKDKVLKLHCSAEASGGDKIKTYTWYETASGELKDIVAVGAKEGYTEDAPILVCDTTKTGTRYYVCYVETSLGGRAYSSVIPVTVVGKAAPTATSPTKAAAEQTASSAPPASTGGSAETTEAITGESAAVSQVDTSEMPGETTEKNTDKTGSSPKKIALIAVPGVAVLGGGTAAAVILSRKKKK